jgi:Domain of unknown function (DUF4249)
MTLSYAAILLQAVLWGCKDPYVSPYKSPPTGYLVVEGYISGNSVTQFTLTRTIPLPGDSTLPTENGATVQIQGSDNSSYPLTGMGNGVYSTADTLALNPQLEYRLSIQTSSGEKYLSDFAPYKVTPSIDSVSWVLNNDYSVQLYVNTHDPANNTRYYQWSWDQTFEYHSSEESYVYYDMDTTPPQVVLRPPADQVYRCWSGSSSTTVLIDNTSQLSADVVYLQPINYIPPNNVQLSVLYSILVKQYALTADGYTFLSLMQKNTESLGSIFDAQPTQITGNIHCLTTPSELVIGYVSAGTVQAQRIWISRTQVLSSFSDTCPGPDTNIPNIALDLERAFKYGGLVPEYLGLQGWVSNVAECVDCTTQGGTNVKPSFWPN